MESRKTELLMTEAELLKYAHRVIQEDPNHFKFGIIASKEVLMGFLLAGIGFKNDHIQNYLLLEPDVPLAEVEEFFLKLYSRHKTGIILLDYGISKKMHATLEKCTNVLPIVVLVPSKTGMEAYLEDKEKQKRNKLREQLN